MPEEILRLKPDQVVRMIKQGEMAVVTPPSPVEAPKLEPAGLERAKGLFGEDFLGVEAIRTMENKFKAAGVTVAFETLDDDRDFPYTASDVEAAKQDETRDRARMVVCRPGWMNVKEGNKMVRKEVNIVNLRDLFKKETRNIVGIISGVTYDNNPFGTGTIFYQQNWYEDEGFAKLQLNGGWGLPTKEVIPASRNKTWDEQQGLLEPGERRREPVEVIWDMLLNYANTGKKVLERDWDWTATKSSDGDLGGVGGFASDGLHLNDWDPSNQNPNVGVCPSR